MVKFDVYPLNCRPTFYVLNSLVDKSSINVGGAWDAPSGTSHRLSAGSEEDYTENIKVSNQVVGKTRASPNKEKYYSRFDPKPVAATKPKSFF